MERTDYMTLDSLIKDKIIILDGASGTQLQARGLPTSVCPEKWAIENPHALEDLQNAYIEAGSNIIYSFTFGASRLKLSEYGLGDKVYEFNRELASLSKKIAGKRAMVAGDISSMGKHLKPYGDLPFEDAVNYFKEQIKGLLDGGVDLFVIETMSDIQEARAALIAVKESCSLPVMVSVTFEKDGKTLTGTTPKVAAQILQSLGADVVGCNCSAGPDKMLDIIKEMREVLAVPVLAKPNAGVPRLENGKTVFDMEPLEFSRYGRLLAEAGINFIGGCCGTSPKHIEQLSQTLADIKPGTPLSQIPPILTSSRKGVYVGPDYPFAIIGERINPTGKKKLQEDLGEGKTTIVGNFAQEQANAGASLLDINVGMPGIDEKATMVSVVQYVSNQFDIPLCIDSSNPEVLEAALRQYPGRALINSVSLESVKIEEVLPLAAKYGSMVIALPVGDEGIPDTLEKMEANLKGILEAAQRLNIPNSYFIADGMVMSASAKQQHAAYTLDFVEWCTKKLGIGTVLGLSNISFGLPERKWVNGAFLAMAMGRGLSLAIANPSSELIVNIVKASEILTGKDENSGRYIEHFASTEPEKATDTVKAVPDNTLKLYNAVIRGNRDGILDIFKECLNEGKNASVLVNEYLIPAITEVGNKFGDGTFFLPQLLLSAEAVKRIMGYIETNEELNKTVSTEKKGKIVFATVKGDVHDIGKNIVCLLLKNHGYDVIDLGKDVPSEKIVDEALKANADIVGLSALMTTTMSEMREVVKIAKAKELTSRIIIGGAVVTQRYADEIGADGYSSDANQAVLLVKKLIGR